MEWLTTTLSGVGLALIIYGLYLAWPPLAFLVGGAGGAGISGSRGGGGGGGSVLHGTSITLSVGSHTITVGGGGAASGSQPAAAAVDSTATAVRERTAAVRRVCLIPVARGLPRLRRGTPFTQATTVATAALARTTARAAAERMVRVPRQVPVMCQVALAAWANRSTSTATTTTGLAAVVAVVTRDQPLVAWAVLAAAAALPTQALAAQAALPPSTAAALDRTLLVVERVGLVVPTAAAAVAEQLAERRLRPSAATAGRAS
tara:strand:- start:328 stop:1110 length:783 start_codon:yes stop_codon:yes gene_type:complete